MSCDLGFEFGVDIGVKPKYQDKVNTDILISSKHTYGNAHVLLLLENRPGSVEGFKHYIDNFFKANLPHFDYDVVVTAKLDLNLQAIKKYGVYKFYQENHSDFKRYIQDNTVIITSGYALQAITESDDLSIECFYDYIFNKTYFFAPQTNTYVFPIDSFTTTLMRWENNGYKSTDCSRLEFAKLQFLYIKDHYDFLSCQPPLQRFHIVQATSTSMWKDVYEESKKYKKVSKDLETDGLDFTHNRIGCISLSFDGKTGFYIPWEYVNKEELDLMLGRMYQIGTNSKFDDKFLRKAGIKNAYTHSDNLQLGHLLNEMRFNGQKSLAYHYTLHGGYDHELDLYIQAFRPASYLDIPLLPSYAAQDAIHAFTMEAVMQEQLTQQDIAFPPPKPGWWKVRDFYERIIMPYENLFTQIEYTGFCVDLQKWNANSLLLQADILDLKEPLRKALHLTTNAYSEGFNDLFGDSGVIEKDELDSGKQLGEILEGLKWPCLGRTKNGWYKTGDEELKRWAQRGHTEATVIQEMRSLLTLQKTFMGLPGAEDKGWRPHITPAEDGTVRIHPSYSTMLMATYRNGCQIPNYQQIPASSKKAELFKQILTVPNIHNQYLVTLDYSSAQIRLAAIDGKDPVLLKAFKENPNADIHSKTGFSIFCRGIEFPIEEIHIDNKVFFPQELVQIKRNGKIQRIEASELVETDTLQEDIK
jgi:DNA polymerase I-like protein with 3'-5' exonuclease and polymerase domains